MAAVNLPDNPANGTTQTVGGITYTYNSSKGYWTAAASSGGGGGGGASVTTDDSAPGSPSDGDLWYDTDDGGMFVYYQDTDSSQWVEVIGSQGSPGPAGAAGATTAGVASVYATVDALPTSGNTQGDMAHVTANNTLYFWNGSGWYRIALINTNPSISGVASAYALAIDGTATTVTMTATDPEGLPITYSIASDTSGNIATVSQGTGSNTNVFTITPSTNTAYAGSFTLTFRASDGVNIATAPATFTLQFSVENSRYTTALITSVGANNATNTSFDDKSTSNHTITANGNVTQTTFSPYRHGGYSTKFVGTEYLKTNSSISLANDFTMEFWIYRTGSGNDYMVCVGNTNSTAGMEVYIGSNGGQFNFYHNGYWRISSTSSIPALNEWSHIAVVRNSGTVTMYLNGTSLGTYSMTDTISGEVYVNAELYNSSVASGGDGYMRDVRIVDGTAIYTSNFTPPTEKLSEVSGTEILLCNLPYIADSSSNNLALTITGTPETAPFTPYDAQEYSAASHLGSASFDGSGDYLEIDDGTWLSLGNGDFCFETWIYNTATSGGSQYIFGQGNSAGQANSISAELYINSSRNLQGGIYVGSQKYATSTGTIPTNIWTHVALVRNGGNIQLYINGIKDGENTSAGTDSANDQSTHFSIGRGGEYNGLYFNGNIADFRFVKGSSVHTGNFTPPTAPLTAITNTELLVQSTDASIIDKAQGSRQTELIGTVSSTTETKYYNSSIYFDGSNDYIELKNMPELPGPFTIEMWIWVPSGTVSQSKTFFTIGTTGSSGSCLLIYRYSNTNNIGVWNGGSTILTSSTAIPQTQWAHLALTRNSSNTINVWIDGVDKGSVSNSNNFIPGTHGIKLGSENPLGFYFNGYMSDVRITKGLARYTSAFTPPAAALQG